MKKKTLFFSHSLTHTPTYTPLFFFLFLRLMFLFPWFLFWGFLSPSVFRFEWEFIFSKIARWTISGNYSAAPPLLSKIVARFTGARPIRARPKEVRRAPACISYGPASQPSVDRCGRQCPMAGEVLFRDGFIGLAAGSGNENIFSFGNTSWMGKYLQGFF